MTGDRRRGRAGRERRHLDGSDRLRHASSAAPAPGRAEVAAMAGVELPVEGEQALDLVLAGGRRPAGAAAADDRLLDLVLLPPRGTGASSSAEGSRRSRSWPSRGLRRLPLLADLPVQSSWWGYYEMSPDHNALVGRGGRAGGLLLRDRLLRPRLPAGAGGRRARGGADRGARADARPVGVRRRPLRAGPRRGRRAGVGRPARARRSPVRSPAPGRRSARRRRASACRPRASCRPGAARPRSGRRRRPRWGRTAPARRGRSRLRA